MLDRRGADWLQGFTVSDFIHDGVSHKVYRRGQGPGVVVMSELLGITPAVTKYASRVADSGLHASPAEIAAAHEKIDRQGVRLLGLRFEGDRLCPPERFTRLRAEFGSNFESIELADSSANPAGLGQPHSLLTEHLIDEEGEPTRAALDRTLAFLKEHLSPDTGPQPDTTTTN